MTRRVVLVAGPPAAGKSTWVGQRANHGELVVDFDDIAQRLGSPSSHDHPAHVASRAVEEQARLEERVSSMRDGTAYVIRAEPDPDKRDEIARRLNATEVEVIDPGKEAVMARMADRPERSHRVADDWYRLNSSPPLGGSGSFEETPQEGTPMSDQETPEQAEAEQQDNDTQEESQEFDAERAKAALSKKNSENAQLRKRLREVEEKASKFDEIEEAKKTEIERISEERERFQFELADANNALVRERIARKHGLPDELAELLPSGDEEQVEAKAKYLSSLVKDPVRLPDPSQGSTSEPSNDSALARALFG